MWKILCLMAVSVIVATAGAETAVLRAGDVVSIEVPGWQEFGGGNMKIDENGAIQLVGIGRVQASGKTVAELEREIELRLGEFVLSPTVFVTQR